MATLGGGAQFPRKFGGSGTGIPHVNRLMALVQSINQQFGDAYDTTQPSLVYARNMAIARALDACWSACFRLKNQWDPTRLSDFLARWQAILALAPLPTDPLPTQRTAVAAKLLLNTAFPTQQYITDLLTKGLGTIFVSLAHNPSATANVWTPAGWPMGQHGPLLDWYSTVARLNIQVKVPTGWTIGQFFNFMAKLPPLLDGVLPAWVDWQFYTLNSVGQPCFKLDDPHNLDLEVFCH